MKESHSLLSLDTRHADLIDRVEQSAGTRPRPAADKQVHAQAAAPETARTQALRWPTGALLPVAFLSLLEIGAATGVIPSRLLPPPSEIAQTLYTLATRDLFLHIGVSTARVAAGFATGSLLAIAFGLLVGMHRRAEALLEPSFQALRAIPSLAWIPLLLLWLGIDETPKVVLIAIGAFFPVYLNLVAGIHNVDRKLIEVGKIHGLSSRQMIRRILLPAALPNLFTGLRTGLSLAWMFLVAAELMAATKGVGYLLSDGRESSRPDIVVAAILILATLGKLSDSALKYVEARKLAWRDVLELIS
ncbi:ABC-type nitrate/sulfonate/bicarbonate transport system, permease component [Herbaspirillum sp. CF444]|uniref:ABC transporter permease n=1 Tax=Herbaspirillum sp. CF444 TaxID=1144319 RepID=UPI0002723395|nr:ABC transporter permease [Herbaspirillum sp. CF444]EJL90754.1 ABC-type nitrate/sulfonate/bicarbonate transport system, permease component [Herbaspirillum sp. CF444]